MKDRRNKTNRTIIASIILLLIVGISIGYARISSKLQINGTAGISKNEWNVHFKEGTLEVTKGKEEFAVHTTDEEGTVTWTGEAHILSTDNKKIEYNVVLPLPGDIYEFEVDIVNDGSIPAELEGIKYTLNGTELTGLTFTNGQASAMPAAEGKKDLFIFGMTYADGTNLTMKDTSDAENPVKGDVLAGKNDGTTDTKRIKVWVKYNDDIDPEDLPSTPLSANLVIELFYAQESK